MAIHSQHTKYIKFKSHREIKLWNEDLLQLSVNFQMISEIVQHQGILIAVFSTVKFNKDHIFILYVSIACGHATF